MKHRSAALPRAGSQPCRDGDAGRHDVGLDPPVWSRADGRERRKIGKAVVWQVLGPKSYAEGPAAFEGTEL